MPDLKISQLVDGDPAQSADLVPIARSGANFSVTAGSIASLGAGANIVPGNLFGGVEGGTHQNKTLFVLIAGSLLRPTSAFKLIMNCCQQASFPGHNVVIGQMAILTTAKAKNTVLVSTPILIGGNGTPTIPVPPGSDQNNPQVIVSDTINLALDNDHDYYIAFFFTSASDNGFWDMSNCPASQMPSFFSGTGNHVGDATIPIISSWGTGAAGRFVSQVVLP